MQGVEPANVPSLTSALAAGKPVYDFRGSTLADGLAVPCVGTNAFELCRQHVDKVVLVQEKSVALAVRTAYPTSQPHISPVPTWYIRPDSLQPPICRSNPYPSNLDFT